MLKDEALELLRMTYTTGYSITFESSNREFCSLHTTIVRKVNMCVDGGGEACKKFSDWTKYQKQ